MRTEKIIELEYKINELRKLIDSMVGTLYPPIVQQDINKLYNELIELKKGK